MPACRERPAEPIFDAVKTVVAETGVLRGRSRRWNTAMHDPVEQLERALGEEFDQHPLPARFRRGRRSNC